ncbi:hypothetical protein [Paenibacillus sp. UNC217MF]|uniref:hypothetical protein n=1 Tax=Paenibacillus sp. UNC217MF TaxID=1449062 RepID=UPI00048A6C85|nr:hypothetical protein [Paenibacillus sp. UNC217MF]
MKHGIHFIEEYPRYGQLLEKLYRKRELDDWYKEVCKKELLLPEELFCLNEVEKINVSSRYWPSIDVSMHVTSKIGEGNFLFNQIIQLRISKIIPVYDVNFCYKIKHQVIAGTLDMWGPPQTAALMDLDNCISEIMVLNGFLGLSELYDLHDTVYEWSDLQEIDKVNRRLTLEDAVFVDILELCN